MENTPRHDWTRAEVKALFALPFNDLLFKAHSIHRASFDPNELQISTLCSIKTGACPEDCKYCAQSGHYNTGLEKEKLMAVEKVLEQAREAKANGATRFCMGAAWRSPPAKEMPALLAMVQGVKALGMESCITLGMLSPDQARQLADAGLDYYNHNLDTSPEYYGEIITTRTYQDRLETLQNVRDAGVKVCCGGILGMGESQDDHVGLLHQLATLKPHPESVPINMLMRIQGSPLENAEPVDPFQFVRTVAVARILMPQSRVRLAAGRENMHEEAQALAYFAGANSIFYGEKLLTTKNPSASRDVQLLQRLGMRPEVVEQSHDEAAEESALASALKKRADESAFYDAAVV
ncbi:biotin synthase BioB [Proteobacteria bacterium 005FR1]|nr:biotin synthase BioB [Proteobacteria bacterium 005FR1]